MAHDINLARAPSRYELDGEPNAWHKCSTTRYLPHHVKPLERLEHAKITSQHCFQSLCLSMTSNPNQTQATTLQRNPAGCQSKFGLTTLTQVWVLVNHVYQMVLSSWVTKFVLKVTWLLDQSLGPTFPTDLICIHAYLGFIQDFSGFPSCTAWLCYDMQWSNHSKYSTMHDTTTRPKFRM